MTETDACMRLEREITRLAQHLRRRPRTTELILDTSAYQVLLLLEDGNPRTLKEIARELELEQSTVNRQVNKAIDRKLLAVERASGPGARRVHSTDAGRVAFAHDRAFRLRSLAAILDDVAPDKRENLLSGLAALNNVMQARMTAQHDRAAST